MRRDDGRSAYDPARQRSAFTLLEVVVALALSGLLLLGGRLFLESLGRAAASTTLAAYDADRAANADRFLRSLVGRLEVGTDHSHHFGGDERSVHFTSWCDTPARVVRAMRRGHLIRADRPEASVGRPFDIRYNPVVRSGREASYSRLGSETVRSGTSTIREPVDAGSSGGEKPSALRLRSV